MPLYELKVKALNCTESLATVGCPCLAAESDVERSRAAVVNAASAKARANLVLFLKVRLLNVRLDFPGRAERPSRRIGARAVFAG